MKKTLLLLAILATASFAHAAGDGNALSVLNTFIATFAKDNPSWKSNIVLLSDPTKVPAGRQLGYSSMIGYYSFTPKTWEELTQAQRQEVYKDPRLKAFLVSLRNTANYPSMSAANVPVPTQPVYPVEGITNPAAQRPMTAVQPQMGYLPQNVQMQSYQPAPQMQQQMMMPQGYQPQMQMQSMPQQAPVMQQGWQQTPAPVNMQNAANSYYQPQAANMNQNMLFEPLAQRQGPMQAKTDGLLPESVMVKISPEEMLLDRPLQIFLYNNR